MEILHRVVFITSLLILAASTAGTKACQEDYFFATQTKIGNQTPTVTPTDGGDETTTVTPTARSGTSTPTAEPGDTATPTPIPTITPTVGTAALSGLMADFKSLGDSSVKTPKAGAAAAAVAAEGQSGSVGNWLGQMGSKDKSADQPQVDSDKDGYMDWLESDSGSDPKDPQSTPQVKLTTRLSDRLAGVDDDADGLSTQEERRIGTDPSRADTDGDSVLDGAEVLSGSNPLSAASKPDDTDHDGLSDDYETSIGTKPLNPDTDGDALSDSLEVAIGTNPRDVDTDRDGISDGKEVQLGSDPLRPE